MFTVTWIDNVELYVSAADRLAIRPPPSGGPRRRWLAEVQNSGLRAHRSPEGRRRYPAGATAKRAQVLPATRRYRCRQKYIARQLVRALVASDNVRGTALRGKMQQCADAEKSSLS